MTLTHRLSAHIDAAIASGREEGVQLVVYQHGQLIVDITRGTRDDAGTPMRPADLTMLWSASKAITATCMHILAERGQLAYDDAIADYWPAFAAHGKDAISIRHLMSHTAGIPFLPDSVTNDLLADYTAMCALVADLHPISRAGQVAAYHGLTYGWPLAQVLEAVDGRSFRHLHARQQPDGQRPCTGPRLRVAHRHWRGRRASTAGSPGRPSHQSTTLGHG